MTEQKPCTKLLTFLTIVSLLISFAALTLSVLHITNVIGVGGEGKKVVISKQYDKGQSLEKAIATKKPMVIFFYTDWCGYCQKFAPTFAKVVKDKAVKKNFAVAYVNCEKPENAKHMEAYGVEGYPTVFVVGADGKRAHLQNQTFFNDDSVEVVKKDILSTLGDKEEDDD